MRQSETKKARSKPEKHQTHRASANSDRSQVISSAARRVLSEWRGIDLSPFEVAQGLTAEPSSALIPRVLIALKLDRRRADAEIVKVWNHLLDPHIVAHVQPTGLHKGTLFVTVDSHVWLHEIVRYRRKEILVRLQHSFGNDLVTRISFRVG